MNGMTDDHKAPVLRIYTERTSDLGGIWAFKPFAMVHCEFVEVSSYNDERDALVAARAELATVKAALVDNNDLLRSALQIAKREGVDGEIASTNWDAYYNRVAVVLKRHHETANAARAALQSTPAQKEQSDE